MIAAVLFWGTLLVAVYIGWIYFRDLGDVTQMVIKVKREDTIRIIRNEKKLLTIGLSAAAGMVATHVWLGAGPSWVFVTAIVLIILFYGFTYVWVHLGLRNQASTAEYFSLEEARKYINPSSSVIVIENNGVARAHSDHQLLQPHLAGSEDGLGGKNVIMTYCGMANLGQGYVPEIDEEKLELCVLAQHGNNLIMRDENTNEPIQQIYGYREQDGKYGSAMQPWPTFRMSFTGFQKAYPEGEVYLRKPSKRPLVRFFDFVTGVALSVGIGLQYHMAEPVMDNMTVSDDRLPKKTFVWGINIGEDAVCYTQDFLIENGNLVNSEIGGRKIVLAWSPRFQSLGAYYNDGDDPVREIDFFGKSDQGQLDRVEMLKSGLFFHVWAEFFPHTDINRFA